MVFHYVLDLTGSTLTGITHTQQRFVLCLPLASFVTFKFTSYHTDA